MAQGVCLQCGAETPYDWAPCPECGWKAPETWEEAEETRAGPSHGLLSSPRKWIGVTAWFLLAAALTGVVLFLSRS